jgi:hypothetical protein
MSMLIKNDLIWVAIPKCASMSIEDALLTSNLEIKRHPYAIKSEPLHTHIGTRKLKEEFGDKETMCIKRDWFEKWLSAVQFSFETIIHTDKNIPIREWVDIDNEFIYKTFTYEFVNLLYSDERTALNECYSKLIKNKKVNEENRLSALFSQNYWKENNECTYEFDIKEMDKFVNFIESRFGEKLTIRKINENPKTKSKIIINDELKSFVWEKFEKRFNKKNYLL